MRSSKREQILEAIIDLVEKFGIASITYDAISEKTGISRGGLIYHFSSRDAMLLATHEFMATRWEKELQAAIGKPANEATDAERSIAYIKVAVRPGSRGEILLLLEAGVDENFARPWREVYKRWAPSVPEYDIPDISKFIARLASDGLWMNDATSSIAMPQKLRIRIVNELVAMIEKSADIQ